jgi:hypothetical protein
VTESDVATYDGATSRALVAVGGSEASPEVRSAIASLQRECSDFFPSLQDQSLSFPFEGLRRMCWPLCLCGWHLG